MLWFQGQKRLSNRRCFVHLLAPAISELNRFEMVRNQPEHVQRPQARRRPTSNVILTLSFNRFIRHQVRPFFRCVFRLTGCDVLKADLCQENIGLAHADTNIINRPWHCPSHSAREEGKRPLSYWNLSNTINIWNTAYQHCSRACPVHCRQPIGEAVNLDFE